MSTKIKKEITCDLCGFNKLFDHETPEEQAATFKAGWFMCQFNGHYRAICRNCVSVICSDQKASSLCQAPLAKDVKPRTIFRFHWVEPTGKDITYNTSPFAVEGVSGEEARIFIEGGRTITFSAWDDLVKRGIIRSGDAT